LSDAVKKEQGGNGASIVETALAKRLSEWLPLI
jgi:hypothetical protein